MAAVASYVVVSSRRMANGAKTTSPGLRLAASSVKSRSAAEPAAAVGCSLNTAPSRLPSRLKAPDANVPCANSESFQAARVMAAPTPRTSPPASMALRRRRRGRPFCVSTVGG
jgi:type VI protein secretion system component VasA